MVERVGGRDFPQTVGFPKCEVMMKLNLDSKQNRTEKSKKDKTDQDKDEVKYVRVSKWNYIIDQQIGTQKQEALNHMNSNKNLSIILKRNRIVED